MQVLIPLPSVDFDPTEVTVPWHVLSEAGHQVVFATPDGVIGAADERVLTGRGFGPWSPILRARSDARRLYQRLTEHASFREPLSYEEIDGSCVGAIVLPGGHAPGMREYLESLRLQCLISEHEARASPAESPRRRTWGRTESSTPKRQSRSCSLTNVRLTRDVRRQAREHGPGR